MEISQIIGFLIMFSFPFWGGALISIVRGLIDAIDHHTSHNPKELCTVSLLCGGLCGIYVRMMKELAFWLDELGPGSGVYMIIVPGAFLFYLLHLILFIRLPRTLFESLSESWKASQLNV